MKKNYLLSLKTIFLILMLICFSSQSFAAHFRFGNATWKRISETATTVTIGVTVNISWESRPSNATFNIENGSLSGGGTSFTIATINTIDPVGGWINSNGYTEITLNKEVGITTLRYLGCCKISTLKNNADGSWNVFTTVNTTAAGNAPVSATPAVINMPVNVTNAVYILSANDPDAGATLTYRFATAAEDNSSPPNGLTLDANTGQITFNTVGKTVGELYNAVVVATDNDGNSVIIDFLIKIIQGSIAPDWDYSVTPANNTVYNITVGQKLTFKLKATDSDVASTVKIGVSGLPNYIDAAQVFSPNLPAQGNLQSESTFTWTPTTVASGKTIALNFLAQDNTGMGSNTSIVIKVNSEAAPEFLTPTPGQNTIRQFVPGTVITDVIKGQSTIGSPTSIVFAKIPTGASLSKTLPTASADPSEVQLSWTPTVANFGLNVLEFQVAIANDPTIFSSRKYNVVINTPSFFESTPIATAVVGQNYRYTVNINDADIALGDQIKLEGITISNWLTLVKQSEKVYVLEGTPTVSDLGMNAVSLKSEDTYHHDASSDNVFQDFSIFVKNSQTITFNALTNKNCGDLPFDLNASSSSELAVTLTSSDPTIVSIVGNRATILKTGTVTISATQSGNDDYAAAIQVDQILNVIDDIKPVVLTKNITVQLNASGTVSIVAADVNDGSTDNCGIATMTLDKTTFSCATLGPNTVILTVTDLNGNSSSATAVVTVEDKIAPTISVPESLLVDADLNKCSAVVDYVAPTVVDNCNLQNNANVVHVLNSDEQFYDFANNVYKTQSSPGLPLTFMPTNGQKMAVFLQSGPSTHYLYQDVSLPVSGLILLTYDLKYTNHSQSFSTNQFIAVQIRNASTNALLRTVFETTSNSPLVTPMTSYSFDVSEFAGQNVRVQLIDATINDFFLDVLLDNVKITGSSLVNGSFESDYTGWTVYSSNSSFGTWGIGYGAGTALIQSAGLPSGSIFPVGLTLNTFTATDASGNISNASFTVTVKDNQQPNVIVGNINAQLNALGTVSIVAADLNNGSTDNCGIATMTLDKTTFSCSNVGPNTVTLTVTDVNGNSSSATAVVTVEDKIAPIVLAKNITVQLNALGTVSIVAADVNNDSSDACGIATMTLDKTSFSCATVGPNTVTLTVTDVNGNKSSATAVVTVEDKIAPIVLAKNITVQLNASGTVSIVAADVNNGSSDACGIATMTLDETSFSCATVGPNTVTLTVTDVNGNKSSAAAVVTVEDKIAPIVLAKNITVQLNASGTVSIVAADVNNGSSDACGIATMTLDKTSFSCASVGPNTVTLTVTDVNGNKSSAAAVVTVEDKIAPIVLAKNITVQLNASGTVSIVAADVNNGSSDACGIATMTLDKTSFSCANVGPNTVTLTVTDVNGNKSSATAVVTVEDKIAPIVLAKNITIQLNALGTVSIVAADVNNSSTDNCGIESLTVDKTTFTCANIGANTVKFTVTDKNGNFSSANVIVTVEDKVAPTVLTKNSTIQLNSSGTASITVASVNNGSSDACGIASLVLDKNSFTCDNVGANTVTLRVTDIHGNVGIQTAIITVEDKITPVVITKNITVQLDDSSNVLVAATSVNNGSTDNCGIASFELDKSLFSCGDVGVNTVRLKVTDKSGNVSYGAATITVVNSHPNLLRKHFDNVIFFDNSSNAFKSYTWYKNGVLVSGQTNQYFKENGNLNGSYYAKVTRKDGSLLTTCPITFSSSIEQEFIKIAPNPVRSNSSYQLITNVTPAKLVNARVTVMSMLGAVMTDKLIDRNSTELIAPSTEGIYIVKMTLSNGQYFTKNLLVKN